MISTVGTGDPLVDLLMIPVFIALISFIILALHQGQLLFAAICGVAFLIQIWNTCRIFPDSNNHLKCKQDDFFQPSDTTERRELVEKFHQRWKRWKVK